MLVRPLLLALLAKGYQLVGAKAPAFDEPHLLMLLPGLVAPVPGAGGIAGAFALRFDLPDADHERPRSEEHTSELQSLMRISYAVFCLTKIKYIPSHKPTHTTTYL